MGQARPGRALDLGAAQDYPPLPPPLPTAYSHQPHQSSPRTILNQELVATAAQLGATSLPNVGSPSFGLGPGPISLPATQVGTGVQHLGALGSSATPSPAYPSEPLGATLNPQPPPLTSAVPGADEGVLRTAQPVPEDIPQGTSGGATGHPEGDTPQGLDPMAVVLSGMAQLQSVVKEMASPKNDLKPEVIKPGVVNLPELPAHGPESCLSFADWLHASKPALADISDSSEELWARTVEEAQEWYAKYLKMDPLTRLTAKPKASEELSQPKWSRVARRIETMIISASPQAIKDEVSASRTSGLLPLLCRLFIIYGPGSLTERELGLKHITDPPAGGTIQETIEILRRWQRWCSRMTELGGVLPDSSLQVRALTKATRSVLQQHPEVAFRVNLARAALQIDLTPDNEKVQKLHAQLLGELEAMAHRGDKDKGTRDTPAPTPAKVKGVEAMPTPSPPPPKKPPKSPPKGPPPVKSPGAQDAASPARTPCSFYSGHNGCKKGADCTYEHDWNGFSASEKAARCKVCGGKTHKSPECRAGARPDEARARTKAKGPPQKPVVPPTPPPPPAAADTNQQQIKSMLADAARMLQHAIPSPAGESPEPQSGAGPSPVPAQVISTPAKAPPQAPLQGTPVTLASLSAQLDTLRAMTRDPEVKLCGAPALGNSSGPLESAEVSVAELREQLATLNRTVWEFEVKTCETRKVKSDDGVALLDSGATHAVIPFHARLQNLERVPVTLAGDEKQEWLRTQGGTLVVPPDPTSAGKGPVQTILPLGALVESLGCQVHWSKRKGLRVVHPTLGVLTTRISDNTCPYVAEDQALRLISELEDQRLERFKQRVQNLECHLEAYDDPIEPTEGLSRFSQSGSRLDAVKGFLAQPYLTELPEEIRVGLAEQIPLNQPGSDRALLKLLPLKRAARRSLLDSNRWAVHLCSGPTKPSDPFLTWSQEKGVALLQVDLLQKGGKGWDLSKPDGVWKVLLWAAAQGRIVAVLSSPPSGNSLEVHRLAAQGMLLWSLASIARGEGIPYVAERSPLANLDDSRFMVWSGTRIVKVFQGSLGGKYLRPTILTTNLDLHHLSSLEPRGNPEPSPTGREWTHELRCEIVKGLKGNPSGPPSEHLDRVISDGLRSMTSVAQATVGTTVVPDVLPSQGGADPLDDLDERVETLLKAFDVDSDLGDQLDDGDPGSAEVEGKQQKDAEVVSSGKEVDKEGPGETQPKLSSSEAERWRQHLLNGHLPYRRDCKQCIEGSGLGPFHRRVKHPRSFALSVDLFGPVPVAEAGRDEGCVTGKSILRYGLVGAFRVPRSLVENPKKANGVTDLFAEDTQSHPEPDDELAEYEPSDPGDELFPELFPPESSRLQPLAQPSKSTPVVSAVAADSAEGKSVLLPEELPEDKAAMTQLIDQLRQPVEQVVLRFFVPLRSKTGPEVTEALQKMILGINQRFPVKSLHHDPGTEFASTSLSQWLAQHGVRVQHSLPTDKKGNGLSERTVGWVKCRIRTLLNSAQLAVQRWPLAARWAVAKHNASLLGDPDIPAFGQRVLHRVKRPADGAKQLMERWVEARYAAPHRSVPEGHVLLTDAGTLVASRGFKSEVIDPTKVRDLDLPALQEDDTLADPAAEVLDKSGKPLRRLKEKTSIKFVECLNFCTSEELAHECLIAQDYSIQSVRRVLGAIVQEEQSTGDRRGIVEGRQILGAYCHGGLRGVTNLTKRKPWTTRSLNTVLRSRLPSQTDSADPSWLALMLMQANDVEVHRDWRNEWGTANYAMHVPGEVELWVESKDQAPGKGMVVPTPTWDPSETKALNETPVSFNPRKHHAVRMQPNWLLVGYTPLGAGRLGERDRAFLDSCEFPSAPPSEDEALVKELVCAPEGPQTPSSILHSSARGGIPSWGTFPIWYGNFTFTPA